MISGHECGWGESKGRTKGWPAWGPSGDRKGQGLAKMRDSFRRHWKFTYYVKGLLGQVMRQIVRSYQLRS